MMAEPTNPASIESRLAVCSWSVQPASPAELCDALETIGIRRAQPALSPLLREPVAWAGTFDILRERGIEIVSGMMQPLGEDYSTLASIARTGGLRPDETWVENREHAAELADLAAAHGISLVTLHAGFMPEARDDPQRQRLIRRVQIIADLFSAQRISVGLETGQESAETLLEMFDAVARPNVSINFDPANVILYGTGDPMGAMRRLAPHIRQVHVKDALPADAPGEWGEEVPVGEGAVDWPAFMDVAMTLDPPVNLVIEREAGENRRRDIRAAKERLIGAGGGG